MRICIVGDADDLSAAYVGWLARERGAEVLSLREDRLGLDCGFSLSAREVAIEIGDESFDLRTIDGAFVRLNPRPAVDETLGVPEGAEHVYAIERRHGLHWLLDEAPFPVVNVPARAARTGRSRSR